MFHLVSNASKYGFITLVNELQKENIVIIDCQVYTQHLESLGAIPVPRKVFLDILRQSIDSK
jgi:leucyl/phenylalanyl-tRNA--protein transferase